MLKNNNDIIIRRMAKRSVRRNHTRSTVLIIAVLLSSFLLFALITIGVTYFKMHQISSVRLRGGEYDTIMYGVTKQQQEQCENNSDILYCGVEAVAGYVKETKDDSTPNVGLLWADHTFWDKMKGKAKKWMKGSYPQKANEVMVTRESLKECGLEYLEVGDSFTMTYGTSLGEETKEFEISGMWSGYGVTDVFYVSKAFYDASGKTLEEVSSGRYYLKFKSSFISQKSQDILRDSMNLSKQQRLFFVSGAEDVIKILSGIIGLILVTCLCAYLLIYNILYLVVAGNVRYYGLLQTIGMTGKQIARFIAIQMLWISGIGIGGGVLLGSGVAFWLVPSVIKALGIANGKVEISFHPLILIGTIFVAGITVFLGSRKPMKIASGVSPIEALAYRHITGGRQERSEGKGNIIVRLAKEQLTKDKKKTCIVMLSLGVSLSVFLCFITLINSQGPRTILSNLQNDDMVVRNDTLKKEKRGERKQTLTQEVLSKIQNLEGIQEISVQLSSEIIVPWEPNIADMWMREFFSTWIEQPYEEVVESYKSTPENFSTFIIGIDEKKFQLLNATLEAPIDSKKFLSGETCILYQNGLDLKIEDIRGANIECGLYENTSRKKSFEIAGLTDESYYTSSYPGFAPIIIVADKEVKLFAGNYFNQKIGISFKEEFDEDTEKQVLQILKAGPYPKDFSYESKIEEAKSIKKSQGNMMEIGIAMAFILTFIGVLNYVNTVSANIQSRKVELAILESLGMTDKQIKKVLIIEGGFFAGGAVALTLTMGLLITYYVFQTMNNNEIPFTVPVIPVVAMIILIGIICTCIPLVTRYILVKKGAIVERIRG